MNKLDMNLLAAVQAGLQKTAFVPMPGGQAEPVAGASAATAAMGAPMGSPPGGAPPEAGGMPPGGAGPMPPELMQMLADPMVQQALNQAGIMIQPDGSAIDGQTGQPIPPEMLMQAVQELMGGAGGAPPGGAPPGPEAMPPEGAPPAEAPEEDPVLVVLEEIRDHLKANNELLKTISESLDQSKKDELSEALSRNNDLMEQMMGGGDR